MHRFCNVDALVVLTLGTADVHRIGAAPRRLFCYRLVLSARAGAGSAELRRAGAAQRGGATGRAVRIPRV